MIRKFFPRRRFQSRDLWMVYLVPTFGTWFSWIYFGQNYTARPGEGYGVGLAITSGVAFGLAAWFLWKYRVHRKRTKVIHSPSKRPSVHHISR